MTKSVVFNDSIRLFQPIFVPMMFGRTRTILLFLLIIFASCEKELNIPLQASNPKLVVEGYIATDQQPVVVLTKSVGFFDKIDVSKIQFVSDAIVVVTDITANRSIQLRPVQVQQFTVYTINQSDPTYNHFKNGRTEHFYRLDITYDNQQYSALTKIPNNRGFDSLYYEPNSRFKDTLYSLRARYSDPDTLGNFYKYFTKRSGLLSQDADFIEPFSSRLDDDFINGQKNIPIDLFLGFEQNDSIDNQFNETAAFGRLGDTITVKLSAMDRAVYGFWKTLDFAEGSVGNPFAAPIQVQSNISNDAFGVWTGYGNAYQTIIIK